MTKLFLSFAVLASLSMVSCGNKAETTTDEAADAVEAVEVEAAEVVDTLVAGDSAVVDTVVAVAETVAE